MTHILFNEADLAVLKAAIEMDESLQGSILLLRDDYAVGPIENIYTEAGMQLRKEWWNEVLVGGDYENMTSLIEKSDQEQMDELTEKLQSDETEHVWIWAAQNSHDVCGYYWLLPYLKPYQGRVQILYLNNLPFINEKGNIFYPVYLSEIPAKEFLKAKKLAREITLSEFEVDPDEWTKLCIENKGVRILEGGKKLAHFGYEYFDAELKKYIMPDWQKASKIIGNCIAKSKQTTGDAYLLWRLKSILASDQFDVQGKLEKMKDFEIKYKSKVEAEAS